MEPKCLCCPDWRRSEIFRNSFGKTFLDSTSIFTPCLQKVKMNIWKKKKEKKKQKNKKKKQQAIQVSNIHIFFYFLRPRMPGLVKLLTENGVGQVKWFWGK